MKTFTAMFLFAVILLVCKIEVDAGSFNLSGSFDPGISFGRNHNHQRKYHARNSENDGDETGWPQPSHINHFERPESLNNPIPDETGSNDNERSEAHRHRSHHRAYRH